ncbi:MAG: hypothetical protein Tsb005_07810 [Gammaproteobacteria bacterium]
MSVIATEYKRQLSDLLAQGHRRFGPLVQPRKPYKDDDEGGDTGTAALGFETHPLLAEQPQGASSDLTSIMTEYDSYEAEQAAKDLDENQLEPGLRKQLQHIQQQQYTHSNRNTLRPF